jgi:hypothetical protein
MGLSPSDEPSSQDHPPQRPIDDNTFYGKMLSGLNAARRALELPPAAAPYLNPAQEALVHALLAIPFLRGRQERERENLYVDRWNHHCHNWCRLVHTGHAIGDPIAAVGSTSYAAFGWLVFHGERTRASRRRAPPPARPNPA